MPWKWVVILIWLWSGEIGPEAEGPAEAPLLTAPATSSAGGAPAPKGSRRPRPSTPLDPEAELDKRAFLAAFRRQAEAALIPCLIQWQRPPNQVAVSATLDRGGHLLHLSSLDPTRPLPACAVSAVQAMAFPAAAASLRKGAVSVQWRLDW